MMFGEAMLQRLNDEAEQGNRPVGSTAWWDDYFAEGGGWERNGGKSQTRIFAEAFCQRVRLDTVGTFTLLDVGCALGDALRVFQRQYPNAELHGVDISQVAISRARADPAVRAHLWVGSIEQIVHTFDVIYVSNVLEHFPNYEEKARSLAIHCKRLCIMVPFNELRDGQLLRPDPSQHHQHTFRRDSFDFLIRERIATSIASHVVSCPGAWGWTLRYRVEQQLKNPLRWALGRTRAREPLQVIFDINIKRPYETD